MEEVIKSEYTIFQQIGLLFVILIFYGESPVINDKGVEWFGAKSLPNWQLSEESYRVATKAVSLNLEKKNRRKKYGRKNYWIYSVGVIRLFYDRSWN